MGIFDSNSSTTCPVEGNNDVGVPIAGSLTFQHVILIAGGACTAMTLALSLSLIVKHLHRYTVPAEQRQIIRMVFTPVVFAIFNLLSIAFYSAAIYLGPIADLYESFALASVLALFVHYVAPDTDQHEDFFAHTEQKTRKGEVISHESLGWFKYIWIVVFVYPVIKTILFIAQEASQATGRYCNTSNNVHFGHIWITILNAIFVAMAVMAILRFYGRFKSEMGPHKPLAKLVSFKVIVFANFIQTLVFGFLNSGGHLDGNTKVTHQDLWLGIPALLICLEQVLFSAGFHYSCRSQEYHPANKASNQPHLGFFSAIADALNPSDLLIGIARAFYLLVSSVGGSSGRGRGRGNRYPQRGQQGYTQSQPGLNNAYVPRVNGNQQNGPQYGR